MAPRLPGGYTLIPLDDIDSTNEEAHRRIAAGAAAGTVVVARRQSAGRGRQGARWQSPPGNLYASVVFRPPDGRPPGQAAFVAAVAAGEAVLGVAGADLPLAYKWPNDLLVDGRKMAGILIEGAAAGLYVLGIGINLVSAPADTDRPAARLSDWTVAPPDPADLVVDFCAAFDRWSAVWCDAGFVPIRKAWLARAAGLGETVRARLATETVVGAFGGLDGDGGLLLDLPDGTRRVVTAGAIYFPAEEGAPCC